MWNVFCIRNVIYQSKANRFDKSSYTIKSKFSLYFLTAVLEGTEYQGFIL